MARKINPLARSLCLFLFCVGGWCRQQALADPMPPEILLASDGQARLSVVTAPGADERTRSAAFDLAEMLGRMSGGRFELAEGDGASGIVVGWPGDFSALPFEISFDPADPRRQEEYVLKSHEKGLYILGASTLALESAVWDLLYRLGHRQFFPHPHWEIVPREGDLRIAIDAFEAPDFLHRHLWTSHGTLPGNGEKFSAWLVRNRARSGFPISTHHIYQSILSQRRAVFDAHPEYLGLVNGKRRSSKFCISNPGLRQVVVDWALDYFERQPEALSVSMEPSDGGGWCECADCAALGSITDRMILLCNTVAEAVNENYPGKFVGTLSYYQHTLPPSLEIHPNVAVNIAMGLRTGGLSTEELIAGWRDRGARIVGLTYNVGGSSAMRNLPRVASEFRHWHKLGINRFTVDIWDQWGQSGLGNYLLARILWDVDESERLDELLDDFYARAFGAAREPMKTWFHLTYRMTPDEIDRPLTEDRLGRMYRALEEGLKASQDPGIQARIGDLAAYTRILELRHGIGRESGEAQRFDASARLMRFVYRTRDRQLVHSKRMFGYPRFYNLYGYQTVPVHKMPEGFSPWKDSRPVDARELREIVAAGVRENAIVEVTVDPVEFSQDLVPARVALRLPEKKSMHMGRSDHYYGRRFYTWVDAAPGKVRLQVRSGRADGGSPKIALYAAMEATLDEVASDRSTPAQQGATQVVTLSTPYAGLHWVEVEGGGTGTIVTPVDPLTPRTSVGNIGSPMWGFPAWSLLFYVPEGTKTVGGFAESGRGFIRDGAGRFVFADGHVATEEQRDWPIHRWNRWRREREKAWEGGYFNIPVPPGQDGKLWDTVLVSRRWHLLTVPPCFAETSGQLLLPREVVERDAVTQTEEGNKKP